MSTRAQIVIQEEGPLPPDVKRDRVFTLIRNSDGYPNRVVPDIKKAYAKFKRYELVKKFKDYEGGERAAYIASLVCSVHPQAYKPMKEDIIWGATELVYCLYAFSDGENMPIWDLEIRKGPGTVLGALGSGENTTLRGLEKLTVLTPRSALKKFKSEK
jgi:hypothetical protein